AFFGFGGAFGQTAFNNKVDAYDVMWVSYEAWGNLIKPVVVSVGAGAGNSVVNGRIIDTLLPYAGVKEIRPTYALKGSEFIAYQRRKDVVTPLVGMATGVVPKPRFMPQENYNFQIMSAAGLQITRDGDGKSGVVYGAKLS
ncbi:major capsid protein, partial [Proteus mirabilis]